MLKMKATHATEAFIGGAGHFVIKQKDPLGGDDSVIILSYEQAVELSAYIDCINEELKEAWNNSLDDEITDPRPGDVVCEKNPLSQVQESLPNVGA